MLVCGPVAAVAAFCDETLDCVKHIEMKQKNVVVDRWEGYMVILVDRGKKRKKNDLDNILERIKKESNSDGETGVEDIIDTVRTNIKSLDS